MEKRDHFIRVAVPVWVEWGEDKDPEALEIFRRVATMPPSELYMTATTELSDRDVDDAIEAASWLWVERGYYYEDEQEGLTAFVTKRTKLWVRPSGTVFELPT